MTNLLAAFFGGTFALIVVKLMLSLGGGWLALSPLTFLFASVLYFLTGKLTLMLLVKDSAQVGMVPDKDDLDFLSWAAVFVAAVPVAWVIGTTLYWDGSYYCREFLVSKGFVFSNFDVYGDRSDLRALVNLEVKEETCLSDPIDYFSRARPQNYLFFHLAWLYTLAVLSVIILVKRRQKNGYE